MRADCTGCAAIVSRWRRKARLERLDVDNPPPILRFATCRKCGGTPIAERSASR